MHIQALALVVASVSLVLVVKWVRAEGCEQDGMSIVFTLGPEITTDNTQKARRFCTDGYEGEPPLLEELGKPTLSPIAVADFRC